MALDLSVHSVGRSQNIEHRLWWNIGHISVRGTMSIQWGKHMKEELEWLVHACSGSLWMEKKYAFFVWLDGAMLVQHASVSTLPQVDQLQTVFIIVTIQAASKQPCGWCLCTAHEASSRDVTAVDLSSFSCLLIFLSGSVTFTLNPFSFSCCLGEKKVSWQK